MKNDVIVVNYETLATKFWTFGAIKKIYPIVSEHVTFNSTHAVFLASDSIVYGFTLHLLSFVSFITFWFSSEF